MELSEDELGLRYQVLLGFEVVVYSSDNSAFQVVL